MLRFLKRAGVEPQASLKVCKSSVRSILDYLLERIEQVQLK